MKFVISEKITESWFTPEREDEDGPVPPSFLLRPLSGLDNMTLRDMFTANAFKQRDLPPSALRLQKDVIELLITKGLRGWKDMPLIDGQHIIFDEKDMAKNLEWLSADAIELLAYEIYSRSTMTEDDKKKS